MLAPTHQGGTAQERIGVQVYRGWKNSERGYSWWQDLRTRKRTRKLSSSKKKHAEARTTKKWTETINKERGK